MITWIYGESGSGKTTLAKTLVKETTGSVLIDGDDARRVWPDIDFSDVGRLENNTRIARLAVMLEQQGLSVVVATICPTVEIRSAVKAICNCKFIHIEG